MMKGFTPLSLLKKDYISRVPKGEYVGLLASQIRHGHGTIKGLIYVAQKDESAMAQEIRMSVPTLKRVGDFLAHLEEIMDYELEFLAELEDFAQKSLR